MADLGNLYPLFQSFAEGAPRRFSFFAGTFPDPQSWKEGAQKRLKEHLHFVSSKVPLDPETTAVEDRGGYWIEKVYFSSTEHIRVPAFVLVPKSLQGAAPGIVALHCHGGFYYYGKEKLIALEEEPLPLQRYKQELYGGRSLATELVHRGYVVVVTDAFYFGERRLREDTLPQEYRDRIPSSRDPEQLIPAFNALASELESLTAKHFFLAGTTWPGLLLWDDLRTVDYLLTRPEVDPQRIGCVGLSLGGWRALHLSALDNRIKATCSVGWMSTYTSMLARHVKKHTWMLYIPGLSYDMDLPDIACLTAPSSLLVIVGDQDPLFPLEGVCEAFAYIEEVYRCLKLSDRFRSLLYPGPHQFNQEMQEEAFSWFDYWLKS